MRLFKPLSVTAAGVLLTLPAVALAQMTLTAAGTSDGFTLTTFASGLPTSTSACGSGGCGPFGTASTSAGNILLDLSANATMYVFHDTDGQTPGSAVSSTPFVSFASALTNANGTIYASGGLGSNVPRSADRTPTTFCSSTTPVVSPAPPCRMAAAPVSRPTRRTATSLRKA